MSEKKNDMQTACLELVICNLELVPIFTTRCHYNDMHTTCLELVKCNLELVMCIYIPKVCNNDKK